MGQYYNGVYFLGLGAGKAKKLGCMIAKSIAEQRPDLSLQVLHAKDITKQVEWVTINFDTANEKNVEIVIRISEHEKTVQTCCKGGFPRLTMKASEFKVRCNDAVSIVVDFVIKNAV